MRGRRGEDVMLMLPELGCDKGGKREGRVRRGEKIRRKKERGG